MSEPSRLLNMLNETQARLAELDKRIPPEALREDGGGGTFDRMDQRVTRLETHFEYVRKDLDEIKADQKTIISALSTLPTKRDLAGYWVASITVGLAILAITVGGIIGGLAWLDRPVPPAAVSTK
mgnify:CR=1 FL=1